MPLEEKMQGKLKATIEKLLFPSIAGIKKPEDFIERGVAKFVKGGVDEFMGEDSAKLEAAEDFIKRGSHILKELLKNPEYDTFEISGKDKTPEEIEGFYTVGMAILVGVLKGNETVKCLAISGCGLDTSDVKAIAGAFPVNLERLAISGCGLEDASAEIMADALPVNLKHLDLSGNRIGNVGVMHIASQLPDRLKVLNLSDNRIDDAGAKVIAKRFANGTLREVNLERNFIGEDAVGGLLNGLTKEGCRVTSLGKDFLSQDSLHTYSKGSLQDALEKNKRPVEQVVVAAGEAAAAVPAPVEPQQPLQAEVAVAALQGLPPNPSEAWISRINAQKQRANEQRKAARAELRSTGLPLCRSPLGGGGGRGAP